MPSKNELELFYKKINSLLDQQSYEIPFKEFSAKSLKLANKGRYGKITREFGRQIQHILKGRVSGVNKFLFVPHVRQFNFANSNNLKVAVINKQAKQWYGRRGAEEAFDFLQENEMGMFRNARSFLDLGGHQLVWAIFYAKLPDTRRVVTFEPSHLNALIGLFNCLINEVTDLVDLEPHAVIASNSTDSPSMLVDFMTTPMTFRKLSGESFDFVKVDIEGYEFELLQCPVFINTLRNAASAHLELHLGHRHKEGISPIDWIRRLDFLSLPVVEMKTQTDYRTFLESCDPQGFHAFLIQRQSGIGERT